MSNCAYYHYLLVLAMEEAYQATSTTLQTSWTAIGTIAALKCIINRHYHRAY